MDVFPTLSALAGVALPAGVVYDGVDAVDVLLKPRGKSKREILWIYSPTYMWPADLGPSAARMGRWKAHWATDTGLGGCAAKACARVTYPPDHPLLFDVEADPSEAFPLNPEANGGNPRNGSCRLPGQGQGQPTGPGYATQAEISAALAVLNAARKEEVLKFKRPVARACLPTPCTSAASACRLGAQASARRFRPVLTCAHLLTPSLHKGRRWCRRQTSLARAQTSTGSAATATRTLRPPPAPRVPPATAAAHRR